MKKIYCFFLLFILFSGSSAYGQEEEQTPQSYFRNIVPPSPNAASLGKYGEVPVSLATGTPNISIPLGEVKQGPLSVPIQLNYHASGIKVEEIASWVGLGWSLDAGGVITRAVRGLADETKDIGYFDYFKNINNTFLSSSDSLRMITRGIRDSEPDKYYFNFLGYSGEILLNEEKLAFLNPHQDIRIEQLSGIKSLPGVADTYAWKATLPNGIQCYFGKSTDIYGGVDRVTVLTEQGADMNATAWYLAKVIAPNNNDSITFEYVKENLSYENSPTETMYLIDEELSEPGFCGYMAPYIEITTTRAEQHSIYKINTSNQSVIFQQDELNRLDVNGSKCLKQVNFINSEGKLLKTYELNTSYFVTDLNPGYEYRLKLDNVLIKDVNGDSIPGHSFEYYDLVLPSRFSFQRDHWGYFNSNTVGTAVPKKIKKPDGTWLLMSRGGSREPDSSKINACMLKKIIYPTGGSSTFNYESHSYSSVGERKVKIPIWKEVKLSAEATSIGSVFKDTTIHVLYPYVTRVNGSAEHVTKYEGEFVARAMLTYIKGSDPKFDEVKFLVASNSDFRTPIREGTGDNTTIIGYRHSDSKEVTLKSGNYKFEVTSEYMSKDNYSKSWIGASIIEGYNDGTFIAGGARIKEIKNDNGKDTYIKRFFYEDPQGISYGALVNEPMYYHTFTNVEQHPTKSNYVFCTYYSATASSKVQLGSSGGAHLSYRQVKVVEGDGYTIHTFTSAFDYPDSIVNEFPFPPSLVNRNTLRGKPKSTYTYDSQNRLISEQTTIYNFNVSEKATQLNNSKIGGLVVGKWYNYKTAWKEGMKVAYKYSKYNNRAFNPLPVRIEKKNYYNDSVLTTTTFYEYDALKGHNQVVRQLEHRGDKTIVTDFVYPANKTDAIYQEMVRRNMIAIPIAEIVSVEKGGATKGILKKQLHHYAQTSAGEPYLKTIEDQTELANGKAGGGVTVYETNVYSNGRLLQEQTLTEGTKAYLWSPDNNYIIAVAQNASHEQILYYSFEADGNTLESKAGDKGFNAGNAGKIIQRPAAGGSYQISYFKKVNGNWEYYIEPFLTSSVTLTGIIDEVRVYPVESLMTTYTYKSGVGVSSVTDPNGQTTYYEYDSLGRLMFTMDDNKNVLQQYTYKYARE